MDGLAECCCSHTQSTGIYFANLWLKSQNYSAYNSNGALTAADSQVVVVGAFLRRVDCRAHSIHFTIIIVCRCEESKKNTKRKGEKTPTRNAKSELKNTHTHSIIHRKYNVKWEWMVCIRFSLKTSSSSSFCCCFFFATLFLCNKRLLCASVPPRLFIFPFQFLPLAFHLRTSTGAHFIFAINETKCMHSASLFALPLSTFGHFVPLECCRLLNCYCIV